MIRFSGWAHKITNNEVVGNPKPFRKQGRHFRLKNRNCFIDFALENIERRVYTSVCQFDVSYMRKRDGTGFVLDSLEEIEEPYSGIGFLKQVLAKVRIGFWQIIVPTNKIVLSEVLKMILELDERSEVSQAEFFDFFKGNKPLDIGQVSSLQKELTIDWDEDILITTAKGKELWVRSCGQAQRQKGSNEWILYGSIQDINSRKKAEIAFELSTKRYQLASRASKIGVWEWDFLQKRPFFDHVFRELYQLEQKDLINPLNVLRKRIHPDDYERAKQELEESMNSNHEYKSTFRIRMPDESDVKYIRAYGEILYDEFGSPTRMLGINIDITKEELQNKRLAEAYREKEEIINSISDGFLSIDKSGSIQEWNTAVEEIFTDFYFEKGKASIEELFASYEKVLKEFNICESERRTTSIRIHQKENNCWLYIIFYPQKAGVTCFIRNITDSVNAEINTSNLVIDALERERAIISSELHDNITQSLGLVKMNLRNFLLQFPEAEDIPQFKKARNLLTNSLNEVRALSHQIMPVAIKDFGLIVSVQDYLEEVASNIEAKVYFKSNADTRFDEEIEINVFRIIQEAVNNSIRHSDATAIEVELYISSTALSVTIADNGKGFSGDYAANGIGLRTMRNRTMKLRGHIEITSSVEGVTIFLQIPITDNHE
jgi:signal transduction histidine kinase